MQRQLAMLEYGFDLGTKGNITWSREELHER
jgi:calcineurin-like phosphoesterase